MRVEINRPQEENRLKSEDNQAKMQFRSLKNMILA
nr:MAG TPA: hypothetical protein [Caudoviricetes sp.]